MNNEKGKSTKKDASKADQPLILGMELGIDVDKRVLKMFGVVTLEVVVLLLSGFFLVKPRWDELNKLRSDLSVQQIQLKNLRTKQDTLDQFQVERANYDKILGAAFPPSKDVGLVLSSLRSLASDSRIDIVGYSVDPVIIDEGEKKPIEFGTKLTPEQAGARTKTENFTMEITISGRALDIQEFLDKINESLPLKVVENVIITRGEEVREESSEVLEMRLEVKNFFLPVTQRANPAGLIRVLSNNERDLINTINGYRGLDVSDQGLVIENVPLGNQNLFGL